VRAAAAADVAVVVAGLGDERESEGFDRETLELPVEQLRLIADVAAANPATVVVVQAGAPVLTGWAADIPAVLLVWYAGDELGDALADVLLGVAEPGGRLPVTFPARAEDAPVLDPGPDDTEANTWHYREGLDVGYRHYDRTGVAPAFCFGHGLGYTRFAYEDLRLEHTAEEVVATVRVRNTGARPGKTVVQLYVDSELRAFRGVELDSGASADVCLTLGERAFSHWDPARCGWAVAPGPHELAVGSSSRRLHLRSSAEAAGSTAVSPRSTSRASSRSSVADESGPQPSPSRP
jgi:beta-glucosidase